MLLSFGDLVADLCFCRRLRLFWFFWIECVCGRCLGVVAECVGACQSGDSDAGLKEICRRKIDTHVSWVLWGKILDWDLDLGYGGAIQGVSRKGRRGHKMEKGGGIGERERLE